MRKLQAVAAALALSAGAGTAEAGIIFEPHLGEYARLPAGQYTEAEFDYTAIRNVYDRDGGKISFGAPFIAAGDRLDAGLALMKFLWVGNVFRDSGVPLLNTHPQFCRGIVELGYEQATGAAVAMDNSAGQSSGANGIGDFYGLCGLYGDEHVWGPLHLNGVLGVTEKVPIGQYNTDSLLNIGTHYWSTIPQLAWHADLYGRLQMDSSLAYQFNGSNNNPAFGGLTPTRPADWFNAESNLTWKFTEHWYADVGYSYHVSIGTNRYDKFSLTQKNQPLPPTSLCQNPTMGALPFPVAIPPSLCDSVNDFYLAPRPGPYADNGVMGKLVTAGFYYVYRSSVVLNARVLLPVGGRGGQIDTVYDVCAAQPCPGPKSALTPNGENSISTVASTQNAVQEASATSASPLFELRLVYLFWAP